MSVRSIFGFFTSFLMILLVLTTACSENGDNGNNSGDDDSNGWGSKTIPSDTNPCKNPEYWPYQVSSDVRPVMVHYRTLEEENVALRALKDIESVWKIEVDDLQFTPPPSDNGYCGPDGLFDIFLWNGIGGCSVDVSTDTIVTSWGGRPSFMIIDPWGPYGGDLLYGLAGHEFNHACQAADDWYEIGIAFEMTSTYIEQLFTAGCSYCVEDFQLRPEWSLFRYDDYHTWYMYGAALYLHYLRDHDFAGDDHFASELWKRSRNTPVLTVNKPNFVDAVDSLLQEKNGSDFIDSAIGFARWRYYTGSRDDGKHFLPWTEDKSQLPFLPEADIRINLRASAKAKSVSPSPQPMLVGSAYIQIYRENGDPETLSISLDAPYDPQIRWVVQAVPGLDEESDGELLDLSQGSAILRFTEEGERTLILTVLPTSEYNPDEQDETRYPVTVLLNP